MADPVSGKGFRAFLLGGIVGGVAGVIAAGRIEHRKRAARTQGLAAFEDAPCFRERLERERSGEPERQRY